VVRTTRRDDIIAATLPFSSLEPRMRLTVAAGILGIVTLTGLGLLAVARANDAVAGAAVHAQDARERLLALNGLMSALQDAETGQRGYLLTGDPRFLEPYERAAPLIPPLLERLGRSGSSARYVELEGALRRQSAELIAALGDSLDTPLPATEALAAGPGTARNPASGRVHGHALDGKARMDGVRTTVAGMRVEVEARLRDSWREFDATLAASRRTAMLSLGAAGTLALALVALLAHYASRRRRAEQAASGASALLRATIDNIMQGLVVLDRDLRVLAWNERFLELRGVPRERVYAGMPFAEVIAAGARLCAGTGDQRRTLSTPLPGIARQEQFCEEVQREDGLEIETRGQPMPDGHYVVTYSDVTPLRRSERAARDQATRLKATLDHIVDGVITINESGSIESFSAGAERMLGWRAEEVLRRDVALLMPDSFAAGHGRAIERHRRTGVNTIIGTSRELEARRKDGTIVPVEISLGEVQLDDRHLYIGVLRDLSERRRVDRLQNELLSTVSHEFRTPLTSIVGALGLLKGGAGGELAPPARRLVDLAHDNGHRLVRLVNDFLDLEKMRSGKLEFRLAPHALAPLLRQSVESLRAYADGYGVALSLALDVAHDDLRVFVDPERVEQVLANLISNAVKFSPRGGTVYVGLSRDGGAAVISVRDEGPGIPPEFRSRVFEKFAQADASDTRGRAGTGLGLSIVKSIVERLDGQVGFDSEPGKGTTFRVGLPLWHTKEAAVTRHGGGRHVLVVEDDPDVATVLGELLRSAGYDARTVGTGADALAAVGAAPVDAVLLDLHLPDRNGRTLVHEFRARFGQRRVPILILSATFGPHETQDASVLGADGCFEKPVDGPRLLESLQSLLPAPEAVA
jgi:PAS domain S-box-containing protein